ncbi:MAG TPA: MFS transporter [Candidatus Paceibacterota bacterium]|nr:MFS transporter [Candidatus Paceibacterota bacterium]
MRIKVNINVKVGRLVKYFVISDFFLLAGWGLIDPVFSVFIVQKVIGGTLLTVGIAAAIYWIIRSVAQIPIANMLDRIPGEHDDFMALIGGLMLVGISAIAMCWVTQIWELYAIHAVQAVAFALYYASWPTIYSRHLDKDSISLDWSLDSAVSGIGAGVTGFLGGVIAGTLGYDVVFVGAGIMAFIAAFVLLAVPDLILPKPAPETPARAAAAGAGSETKPGGTVAK